MHPIFSATLVAQPQSFYRDLLRDRDLERERDAARALVSSRESLHPIHDKRWTDGNTHGGIWNRRQLCIQIFYSYRSSSDMMNNLFLCQNKFAREAHTFYDRRSRSDCVKASVAWLGRDCGCGYGSPFLRFR